MSWQQHLDEVCEVKASESPAVMEAAIVGMDGCIWVATGGLSKITAKEVKMLTAADRSDLYEGNLTVAGERCTVLRDWYADEGTMDLQTKPTANCTNTYSISLAASKTALVIVKGLHQVHARDLGPRAIKKANYLKSVSM